MTTSKYWRKRVALWDTPRGLEGLDGGVLVRSVVDHAAQVV